MYYNFLKFLSVGIPVYIIKHKIIYLCDFINFKLFLRVLHRPKSSILS